MFLLLGFDGQLAQLQGVRRGRALAAIAGHGAMSARGAVLLRVAQFAAEVAQEVIGRDADADVRQCDTSCNCARLNMCHRRVNLRMRYIQPKAHMYE